MPKALTAARRAAALDPQSGEAHCALAAAVMFWERDYARAREIFQRGLELNPNNTQGRCWYGLFLLQWIHGEGAAGLAELRLAHERDPLSAYTAAMVGFGLSEVGDPEALRFVRQSVERDPDGFVYHWIHSIVAHWAGALDEAIAASDKAAALSNRHHYALSHRAVLCAEAGRLAEARAVHDEIASRRARQYDPFFALAVSASAIGDMDAAIEYAHQGCDEREPGMVVWSRIGMMMRPLRADPRFAEIERRLALPPIEEGS
jgi:tetratricopeptide (TPR) repeat protein